MKNIALILASGSGSRCELSYPKQFAEINGKTILEYTLDKFEFHKDIDEIIIVTSFEYIEKVKSLVKKYNKVTNVVKGGNSRKESSYNGVFSIDTENDSNILIHDGVRPFVTAEIITRCINSLNKYSAVCTAIDSTDTIYYIDNQGIIKNIPDRTFIKRAQTPQCFKLEVIKKAHTLAKDDNKCKVTDDCGLIKHYNLTDIAVIEGDENNIKITYPKDIELLKNKLI